MHTKANDSNPRKTQQLKRKPVVAEVRAKSEDGKRHRPLNFKEHRENTAIAQNVITEKIKQFEKKNRALCRYTNSTHSSNFTSLRPETIVHQSRADSFY